MSAEWDASQDALRLPFPAIHSGWEGQDLGLPLLHVLGKKPGAEGLTSRLSSEVAVCRERHQEEQKNAQPPLVMTDQRASFLLTCLTDVVKDLAVFCQVGGRESVVRV